MQWAGREAEAQTKGIPEAFYAKMGEREGRMDGKHFNRPSGGFQEQKAGPEETVQLCLALLKENPLPLGATN